MGWSIERRPRGRAGLVAAVGAVVVLVAGCNLGTPPVTYSVTTSDLVSDELAGGDLNGDGATDLVVGAEGAYTVLLNDGAGGYTATEVSTMVPTVAWIVLEDLDTDGDLDMVAHDDGNSVPGHGTPATYRFLGDGTGDFGPAVALGNLRPRASGDLDGDGHADLVSSDGQSAIVRLGDGAGGFGSPTVYPIPGPGTFGFGAAEVADFTGEGDLDVIAAGAEVVCGARCTFTSTVVLLTGDGTGALTAGTLRPAAGVDVAVGDFDEDGSLDTVTTHGALGSAPASLSLLLGDGAGDLTPAVPVPISKRACEVEADDIDRDGHIDLVLSTEGNTGTVLFGDGAGHFPDSHEITTAGGPSTGGSPACNRVLSARLDGDANPDVAFVSHPADALAVLLNRLNGRPSQEA